MGTPVRKGGGVGGVLSRSPSQRLAEILEKQRRPPIPFKKGRKEVCRYNYLDENGHLAFFKIRYALDPAVWNGRTKDFRCFSPSPVNPNLVSPGAPEGADYLYRLPELLAGPKGTSTLEKAHLHFCEGEKDTDALISAGCWATTSHAGALKCSSGMARWAVRALHLYRTANPRAPAPVVWVWVDKDWPSVTRDPRSDPRVGAFGAALRANALRSAGWKGGIEFVRARGPRTKDPFDHLAAGFSPVVDGVRGVVLVDPDRLADLARSFDLSRGDPSSWAGYEK